MSQVITLTDATFDEIVNSTDAPVVVDFWAEWCVPCHKISPMLDELATERGDAVQVTKLNIDENPAIAQRLGVMSIPTVMVFRNGELDKKVIGAKPKNQLIAALGV